MKIDLSKYNVEIPESMMVEDYAFDIQKRFERGLLSNLEKELEGEEDVEYKIQSTIDNLKQVMFFEVTEEHGNNIYRGRLVKGGGSTIRELNSKYYFLSEKKLNIGSLAAMFDNLYIHEHLSDMPKPPSNQVESSFENPLADMKDELTLPPVSGSQGDATRIKLYIERCMDLYINDSNYAIRKVSEALAKSKLYKELNNDPNRPIILKALSFVDEMTSDKKVSTIEEPKARQTFEDAINQSAKYYNISPELLSSWIGKRNGFKNKKKI